MSRRPKHNATISISLRPSSRGPSSSIRRIPRPKRMPLRDYRHRRSGSQRRGRSLDRKPRRLKQVAIDGELVWSDWEYLQSAETSAACARRRLAARRVRTKSTHSLRTRSRSPVLQRAWTYSRCSLQSALAKKSKKRQSERSPVKFGNTTTNFLSKAVNSPGSTLSLGGCEARG